MPNPFAALGGGGSDDEDVAAQPVAKNAPKETKSKPSKSNPNKVPPAAEVYRGGQSDTGFDSGDTRRGRGRGGRGGRGRGGIRGDIKRSQGRGGNKPDEKRSGHGTGNWGSKDELIDAATAELASTSMDASSPVPTDDVADTEDPEEPTLSYDEYLAQQAEKKSKVPALKLRGAGEGDTGIKKGEALVKKVDEGPYGGSKYGNKTKKLLDERKGRAANSERLLIDLKYAPSEQVETRGDYAPRGRGRGRGDGERGRGRGRGRGDGRGRGRGDGRSRGRGEGRGRGRGGSRGGGRGGSSGAAPFNAEDFPSL